MGFSLFKSAVVKRMEATTNNMLEALTNQKYQHALKDIQKNMDEIGISLNLRKLLISSPFIQHKSNQMQIQGLIETDFNLEVQSFEKLIRFIQRNQRIDKPNLSPS
jgi:hypothetical protein